MHTFDRRRDGQTTFSSLVRAGILYSAEKIKYKYNYREHDKMMSQAQKFRQIN